VLAGFEFVKWNAGVDVTNRLSVTPDTIEAGSSQRESMNFGDELKTLCAPRSAHWMGTISAGHEGGSSAG
jgi:hypothetical protein